MTIDDNQAIQQQHLDLIEFCIAEFDITQQEHEAQLIQREKSKEKEKEKNRRDDDLKVANMRKWPRNRIVNYELLRRIKKKFLTFYNEYMEKLLLFQIDQINKFTCYLELDKIFENCSTTPTGSNCAVSGSTPSAYAARRRIKLRSLATRLSAPSCRTFPTAGVPSLRTALCACATEPDANGSSSKEANRSGTGLRSSRSTRARARPGASAGTDACKLSNPPAVCAPTRSGRMLSDCPSLTQVVPSSVSAAARRCPAVRSSGFPAEVSTSAWLAAC